MKGLLRLLGMSLFLGWLSIGSAALEPRTIAARGSLSRWLPRTLPSDFIHCLAVDEYDTTAVYVGTQRGLVWTDGRCFRWLGQGNLDGPPPVGINDILQFRYYIVVGTDRGLSIFNYTTLVWEQLDESDGLPGDCIQSLAQMDENHLLLGSWGQGVIRFNIVDRKPEPLPIPGFGGRFITDILIDRELNKIMVASLDGGLAIYQGKNWTVLTVDGGKIPADRINALAGDGTRCYAATPRGLLELSGGAVRILTSLDGLASDNVLSVWADGYDVWLGTAEGISHLYDGKITSWPLKNSLSRGRPVRVTCLMKCDTGLWFGTQHAGLLHQSRDF